MDALLGRNPRIPTEARERLSLPAVYDDQRRVTVAICDHMDLGDAREWSDDPHSGYRLRWITCRAGALHVGVRGGRHEGMNIRKRLETLEKRFASGGNVLLTMPDGSQRVVLLGPGEDILDLFSRVKANPDSDEARIIRESISSIEPGGGRVIELIQAFLLGPLEPEIR